MSAWTSALYRTLLIVITALSVLTLSASAIAADHKLPKVGVLWGGDASNSATVHGLFVTPLKKFGWVDGKTVQLIVRYGGDDRRNFVLLAKELVTLGCDVIVVTDLALPAAKQATSTIPIVAMDMFDPIAEGVTTSLARPTGNVVGVSWQSIDTAAKRVEVAKDLLPGIKRAVLLYDGTDPGAKIESGGFIDGARRLGVQLRVIALFSPDKLDAELATIGNTRPDVFFLSVNPLTWSNLDKIVQATERARVPLVSEIAEFAESGALVTYGVNVAETYARAADLTHRILKGAKLADLAFEQPTLFDLVINLKTAKALGIKVPESMLLRATKVIR